MVGGFRWGQRLVLAAVIVLAASVLWVPSASPAPLPQLLWQVPEDGKSGGGAGQIRGGSVAVDPLSGNVFVADAGNARIDEFDPWGQFIKAFGWGVVASGPDNKAAKNERQELDVSSVGSSYKLVYLNAFSGQNGGSRAQQTSAISSSATAAAVEVALEGLESLSAGDVKVEGTAGGPYTVEFTGQYADSDIPPLLIRGTSSGSAATLQDGGSFEVCVAGSDVCQPGQSGGYVPGHFPNLSGGLAIDGAGHLFVHEAERSETHVPSGPVEETNLRVQEYSLEGEFVAMWGKGVDRTTGADICAQVDVEGGDECGPGLPGAGPGQFRSPGNGEFGGGIAVGPEGHVFAGDVERIQEFEPNGSFAGEIPVFGETIGSMAMNGLGEFYATFKFKAGEGGIKPGIHKLNHAGAVIGSLGAELRQVQALAVGIHDELYAAGRLFVPAGELPPPSIVKFSSAGNEEIGPEDHFDESSSIGGLATSDACGIEGEDVFAVSDGAVVRAFGPPPDPELCPPPVVPPTITASFVSSVNPEGAVVRALINPHFWPDTRYRVEYGTGKCSEGGCTSVQPDPPGAKLTSQVIGAPLPTAGVFLRGLSPATTYHYRFVAESGGGGPAFGPEGSLKTFPLPPAPNTNCPNQSFRSGASALLPDCRAYEMVSPVDKGGADIMAIVTESITLNRAALDQASIDGSKLTYSTYRAFGDVESAPYSSQYTATRTSSGWQSEGISPPRGRMLVETSVATDTQFKAFSPDLCNAWVLQETDALLAPGAVSGFPNLYRRQNCEPGADSYQPLTTIEPPNRLPGQYRLELQGISADGAHALFLAPDSLTGTPDPGPSKTLLYEAFGEGQLRLVCILPNGKPVSAGCSAGTSSSAYHHGRTEAVSHAISTDGSRIFWSDAGWNEFQGKIYVRINGKQTVAVSKGGEELTGREKAQYWTAAADGSRAIFTVGEMAGEEDSLRAGAADLYEFDVGAKTTSLIAHGVYGVLGASEDAKRIFFVSKEALAAGAVAGEPNLYLHEAGKGEFTFIATLSKADAEPGTFIAFSPINYEPSKHTAQVTSDGTVAVFMSTAPLTGIDNTDAVSGRADAEVYRFDATADQLTCISCNSTGARPTGRNISEEGDYASWAAARLPAAQSELYPVSRALSANGGRAFFESFEPLVPTDTNGAADIYEWESLGEGDCVEDSAAFNDAAGGCVSLISSGEDPSGATLVDTDPSGENVFFTTHSSLLPQDPGLIDIYDARVGGGFPPQAGTPSVCEGEACQGSSQAPNDPTPASSSFQGSGNVIPQGTAKKKHKHKKHKKHKKHHKKKGKANSKRGGAK